MCNLCMQAIPKLEKNGEGVAKLQFGAKSTAFARDRIQRKSPTLNRVCQLALNSIPRKNHRILPPKRVLQFPLDKASLTDYT